MAGFIQKKCSVFGRVCMASFFLVSALAGSMQEEVLSPSSDSLELWMGLLNTKKSGGQLLLWIEFFADTSLLLTRWISLLEWVAALFLLLGYESALSAFVLLLISLGKIVFFFPLLTQESADLFFWEMGDFWKDIAIVGGLSLIVAAGRSRKAHPLVRPFLPKGKDISLN